MHNTLVSILIPFKNVEDYFEECLSSIENQEYLNWEVIAINDHSKDNSFAIAKGFQKNNNRFKVFNNDGEGIIEALRMAYSKSEGAFITRMDADDYMAPNRVSEMVTGLMKNGVGSLAIGQVRYFSKEGVNDGYLKYEKWLNSLTAKGTNFYDIYKECVIPSPCWMVHKTDFDNCEGFLPNRYPEDYDLAFRFYEQHLKLIACSKILHYWRDYQTRTSRTSEHYAQNYFLTIKLYYFLKLEYEKSKNLVIWGAGKKGKEIAKSLRKKDIPFLWVCDNHKKIGKDIYDVKLQSFTHLKTLKNLQIIITVANKEEQLTIHKFCESLSLKKAKDYFFFC